MEGVKIVSTVNMDRSEWLEHRSKGIGGSDIGIIFGLNKYKTPFELWLEKTGQVDLVETSSEAAYWGNKHEQTVAEEFTIRTGKKVRRRNQMLRHKDHEFLIANLDREVVGEKALLECKSASEFLAKEWEGDEVPATYILQCQSYMAVTGYKKAYIACLIGGNRFIWKEIERDDEIINMIIEQAKTFWFDHVLAGVAPALDGSSAAEKYIKEKYAKAEAGLVIDLKAEHKTNLDTYLQLKEEAKELDSRITEIENKIKFDMKEAETGFVQNYRVNWKSINKKGGVDSKKLEKEFPDIYAQVVKESTTYRKFEVKVDK